MKKEKIDNKQKDILKIKTPKEKLKIKEKTEEDKNINTIEFKLEISKNNKI